MLVELQKKLESKIQKCMWQKEDGKQDREEMVWSMPRLLCLHLNHVRFRKIQSILNCKNQIDEGLYELFKPFGYLNRELGNKRLGEIYVTDKNGKLLLKLQGHIGSRTLKVSMLDKTAGHCNSFSALDKKINVRLQNIRCVWDVWHVKVSVRKVQLALL